MRWDKEVENKLREYPLKCDAAVNLQDRIKYLNSTMYSLSPSFRNSEPVQGGGNKTESKFISRIVEKEELEKNLKNVKSELDWVNKGLSCLDDVELKVIDSFYLRKIKISKEKLAQEMGYNKQHLYKIKDRAIYKMALELYGVLSS